MPGLASAAALAAATMAHRLEAPLMALDLGKTRYEVISVNDANGLGGLPPYCAGAGQQLVMVLYRVTNGRDVDVPGEAVPHLVLIDDEGLAHPRDVTLTQALESRDLPLLSFPQHRLMAHQSAIQADVFVTPQDAIRRRVWRLRPATAMSLTYRLPPTKPVFSSECPLRLTPRETEPEADALAPAPKPPE